MLKQAIKTIYNNLFNTYQNELLNKLDARKTSKKVMQFSTIKPITKEELARIKSELNERYMEVNTCLLKVSDNKYNAYFNCYVYKN